ncbi:radical SAM family heme chaperone HemW [Blautia schinkii]|nr:radical SAM family heme chaperone HemW [Blautia schinkii]
MTENNTIHTPLELYVHIPFCVKKCDYCDFLSGPATPQRQEAYIRALLSEIEAVSEGCDRDVVSVFIGGGTPSVLAPELIAQVLDNLIQRFHITPDAEITIEANPGTLHTEKLKAYREHGVNRLSLGLQSPDEQELKTLGRIHSYHEFLESFHLAREAGFTNINVDLMSAIPGQSYEQWIHNLRTVASLAPEHISAYSLIVEEGTPFAERTLDLPDEETEYRMYEDTARVLGEYGYSQYEISNYAKPGYACHHNIGYWKRVEYLGLGLGAASLWENRRFSNTSNMEEYLQNSSQPHKIRRVECMLSIEDQMAEFMFLGLRMTEGISKQEFAEAFGVSLEERYGAELEKFLKLSLLEDDGNRIWLTRRGIHVSNTVMAEFLPG